MSLRSLALRALFRFRCDDGPPGTAASSGAAAYKVMAAVLAEITNDEHIPPGQSAVFYGAKLV